MTRHRPTGRAGRHPLTIRARWAMVCAVLVTLSGAVVLVVMLVMTDRLLHDNAPQALGLPARGTPPPATAPPGGAPRPEQAALDQGHGVTTDVIREVRLVGLGLLGALALASVGIGWVVAGRMLRPIERMTETAEAVSGSRLGDRIALDGPDDELTRLGATFDAMLDRLDAAFAAQRAVVADVAHEIRTPLAVMRTQIEVALDEPDGRSAEVAELRAALESNLSTVTRTTELAESMLHLSRAQALATLVDRDLADSARAAADAARSVGRGSLDTAPVVHLSLRPAAVRGDPVLLDRLAGNLVDNAVIHSPPGTEVWVSTGVEGADAVLRVENGGPEIAADHVPRLFERFHRRSAHDAPGSGLGLAIVAAVVATHGGTVAAEPRTAGGLAVTVRLPAVV